MTAMVKMALVGAAASVLIAAIVGHVVIRIYGCAEESTLAAPP